MNSSYSKQLQIAHTGKFSPVGEMLSSKYVYFKSNFYDPILVIFAFCQNVLVKASDVRGISMSWRYQVA